MVRSLIVAAATLAVGAFAQTHTDCSPLLRNDCPIDPAIGMQNWTYMATDTIRDTLWSNIGGTDIPLNGSTRSFTLAKKGDSPTLRTTGYFFHGSVSVIMKAAPGQGIISAITALSDDLDEIDFEFKGGVNNAVFTNWYGKQGNTGPQGSMSEGAGMTIPVTFDPRADFHNYTYVFTNDAITWLIDGNVVRSDNQSDPLSQGGKTWPQTPMRLAIGGWAGGDSPSKDTVTWAGGPSQWDQGPFTMAVKQVVVSDAQNATSYKYGDNSGSAQSIQVSGGQSDFSKAAADQVSDNTSLSQQAQNKFNSLSTGAKIGIAAGALGLVVVLALIMAVCCIKQRRAGRKEAAIADADFQKHEAELMAYRQANGHRQAFQMPAFGHHNYKQHM